MGRVMYRGETLHFQLNEREDESCDRSDGQVIENLRRMDSGQTASYSSYSLRSFQVERKSCRTLNTSGVHIFPQLIFS